jgi:hypothetical protein
MRDEPGSGGLPQPAGATLEREAQAHIGRKLREIYSEIAHEAVPDRFLELLEQLELREAGQQ